MAKDFAAIFATGNDSIALEQKVFVKEETVRGTFAVPVGSDEMLINTGAAVNFSQPIETSPVRTGRHHTSIIKQKTTTEWTLPSLVHIDSSLGAAADTEIDQAYKTMWKAMLGREQTGPLIYDAFNPPNITLSIFENGDLWALQAPGSFVQTANVNLPGDGDATVEFGGMSKTALLIGVAQSNIDNDGGSTITVGTDEGKRFEVGGVVMLVESDGTTRSGDTLDGAPLYVSAIAGDVITLSSTPVNPGTATPVVLADANGSVTPLYLSYYEPEAPVTPIINDPQTGLEGTITIGSLTNLPCIRSLSLSMNNNHEATDFCFGEAGLASPFFTPGDRLTVEATVELNLNHDLVEFINSSIKSFDGEAITAVLGDVAGRRAQWVLPKVIFPVPEITPPDTGTIPVSFTGNANQSGLDLADEVTLSFL